MSFNNEAEVAAYLDQREQAKYNRLLLNRFFQGTVSNVRGRAGTYQVQVIRTGNQPDQNWYPLQSTGYLPMLGDKIELQWRDDNSAYAVSQVQTAVPRLADMHNYRARLFYLNPGNPAIPNGWNVLNFGSADYDPAGMTVNSNYVVAPLPGQYNVACCCAVTQSTGCVAGIAINGAQVRAGVSAGTSQVVTTMPLNKGDQVQTWIFANGASNIQGFADRNWMTVDLINAF